MEGWSSKRLHEKFIPFYQYKDHLSTDQSCLFRGNYPNQVAGTLLKWTTLNARQNENSSMQCYLVISDW